MIDSVARPRAKRHAAHGLTLVAGCLLTSAAAAQASAPCVGASCVRSETSKPATKASARAANEPGTIIVNGVTERGDGPVNGYRALRTTTGSKTDTALKDIPQDIVVVPRQVIEDTAGSNQQSALDYVGGIGRGNNFGGLNVYETNSRGLPTRNVAMNGISPPRNYEVTDSANIERIEVMMGPSGALYGRNDPGGFYNIITKQPLSTPLFEATITGGSYNTARGTIDFNAVSRNQSVAARINLAVDRRDSFRDFVKSDRYLIAPVLLWRLDPATRVSLEGEYIRDSRVFDRGVVAVNKVVGLIPIDRFLSEPSLGRIKNRDYLGSAKIEHDFDANWTAHLTVQNKGGRLRGTTAEPISLAADGQTLRRRIFFRDYTSDATTVQAEVVGKFATGFIHHTLLIGTEEEFFRKREKFSASLPAVYPYAINIYNPVYGQVPPPFGLFSELRYNTDTYAAYASDQLELTSRLKFQLSIRLSNYVDTVTQLVGGKSVPENLLATTPRIGGTYEIVRGLTLFADASKSFRPNLDSDTGLVSAPNGGGFPPERGTGQEAGFKLELLHGQLGVTGAVFHIVKNNVLTADPANPGFNTISGQVRSKGFDVNVSGNLTPEIRIIGGYLYADAEVTKDNVIPIGSPIDNIPKHSFSMLGVYEVQRGPIAGLGIGAGVKAVTHFAGNSAGDGFLIPGYSKVDLLAYYPISKNLRLQVNVANVFDKRYYAQARSATLVTPGDPRSVLVSLKYVR